MPDDKKTAEGGNGGETTEQSTGGDAITFDSFYSSLDERVRGVLDEHVKGLKSAHERTKQERNELREAIKSIKESRETDIEAVKRDLTARLEETEKRARFLETIPAEVTNQKAALAVAREFGAMRTDGSLDAEKLREVAPELFKQEKAPPSNAGKTNGADASAMTMNNFIRSRAGLS